MTGPPRWRGWSELPYAHGGPAVTGLIRSQPEDFQVDEILSFAPDGAGEHAFLKIRKRGANTEWVARQLARFAGVSVKTVGYAGLKDRQAITTQWFSVHLPGCPEPDWQGLDEPEIQILESTRNRRKLRRGALRGNAFRLQVCELAGDLDGLAARLQRLGDAGVPNYYGPQRFGHDYGNLDKADRLFAGSLGRIDRHVRGLYLSAARSQLFNEVLAKRVGRGDWNRPLPGDRMQLDGARASFLPESLDESTRERAERGDIHPSGPLWGEGECLTAGAVSVLEQETLAPFEAWRQGLERYGMRQERRPLRVNARRLSWELEGESTLLLSFELPAGSYATALLRECVESGMAS